MDATLISGERFVFTTRKHWVALVTDSGWAILMVVGSFALAWVQPDNGSGVLGFISRVIELIRLGLFLGGCGWIVYNVIAWGTAEYAVTNRRVLGHEGLIRRRSTDTLLMSLSDIRSVQPGLGRLLGYGNIRIISASGDAGKDTFTAVHGAEAFKQQVLEQKAGSAEVATDVVASANGSVEVAPKEPTMSTDDAQQIVQLLAQLANLRDTGAITPEEYDAKKGPLLSRI